MLRRPPVLHPRKSPIFKELALFALRYRDTSSIMSLTAARYRHTVAKYGNTSSIIGHTVARYRDTAVR